MWYNWFSLELGRKTSMRLCNLDEIKIQVKRQYEDCHGYSGNKKTIYREAILAVRSILHSAKTIDAVPVVRCRECKHRYTENCPMYFHDFYWLEGYGEYVDDDTDHTEDDYFCHEGERKEGDDNGT